MPRKRDRVLVIQPTVGHEAFLLGGTISRLVAEGNSVTVVTVCQSLDIAIRREDKNQLYQSLIALKITDHRFLGTHSNRKSSRPPALYYSPDDPAPIPVTEALVPVLFDTDHIQEISLDLESLIEETKASSIVIASLDKSDRVSATLRSLVEVLAEAYEIPVYCFAWEREIGSHDVLSCTVEPWLDQKRKAIASYPQIARLTDREHYQLLVSGKVQEIGTEELLMRCYHPDSSVTAGSTIAGTVTAVLFAGLVAVAGSLIHQSTTEIDGGLWPTGVAIGLLAVIAALLGVRLTQPYSRIPIAAAAITVVSVLVLISMFGFFGITILPENTVGIFWLVGAAFTSILIAFWPKISHRNQF